MVIQQHNPMHPGAFIKRVYLQPNNIGSNELARKEVDLNNYNTIEFAV